MKSLGKCISAKDLFSGRDLKLEWSSRKDKYSINPVYELPWRVDIDRLRRQYEQLLSQVGQVTRKDLLYERGYIRDSLARDSNLTQEMETYWEFILSQPMEKALEIQAEKDGFRKMHWSDHQKRLSAVQKIKSFIQLNADYDPLADERVYRPMENFFTNSYLGEICDKFKAQVNRVRIVKLKRGQRIYPHIDSSARFGIRAHIPILSNQECRIFFQDRRQNEISYHLEPGKAYLINPSILHWVKNGGNCDRVHLLMGLDGQEDLDSARSI